HFDGVTSSAIARWNPATHASGMTDYVLPFVFTMPSANPTSIRGLGGLSDSSTEIGAGGIGLRLAINGDLQLRMHGATTGDYRQMIVAGARAAYAGKMIAAYLVVEDGAPTLYIDGEDAELSTETTAGTAPAWSDTPASDYFLLGVFGAAELWQGALHSPGPLN